jgi:hypothetical protein
MTMSRSGDRHNRSDPEGRLGTLLTGHRQVTVVADPTFSATVAGQHLLQMLVNLLARQYGVIDELIVAAPAIPAHQGIFHLHPLRADLETELIGLGKQLAGREIQITQGTPVDTSNAAHGVRRAAILVGAMQCGRSFEYEVGVVGDGWRFQCSTKAKTSSVEGASKNPFGPYMAACYAAASVFKFLHSVDAEIDLAYSLWDWNRAEWGSLGTGRDLAAFELGPVYSIGLGAVGAASMFTLASNPGLQGKMVLIDPQKMDVTNRNRLVSGAYGDVDKYKVDLAVGVMAGSELEAYPYVGRWPDYSADPSRSVPAAIRSREREDRFDWVLSSVDRNIQRRAIANSLPRHVIGGSSMGMTAQASYYANLGNCECLACAHPAELVPSIEELTEQLGKMNPSERIQWYEARDVDPEKKIAIEEFLRDPGCARVGGQELHRLGIDGTTDWAVGFVSVAAGIMQSALLVQCKLLGVEKVLELGSQRFAWFLCPDLGASFAKRKANCDFCGEMAFQERAIRLWV